MIVPSSCDMTYQSQCTVSCDDGFTGDDVTYLCNVTSDPTMVDWVPIGGLDVMCERGLLISYRYMLYTYLSKTHVCYKFINVVYKGSNEYWYLII